MQLQEYIKICGIKKNFIAKELNISLSFLWKLLNGLSAPSVDLAFKIEKMTNGRVKAKDWITKEPDLK